MIGGFRRVRFVDQQLPVPVIDVPDSGGAGIPVLRVSPLRHVRRGGNRHAAVGDVPLGTLPVPQLRPGILQKRFDVRFIEPAVPLEEDLSGSARGGAELVDAVPV